jgi:hypothetical protein
MNSGLAILGCFLSAGMAFADPPATVPEIPISRVVGDSKASHTLPLRKQSPERKLLGTTIYQYDPWYRLVSAESFDATGRRISKVRFGTGSKDGKPLLDPVVDDTQEPPPPGDYPAPGPPRA